MIKLRDYCFEDKKFVKEVLNEVQDQYNHILPGYIKGLGRYFDKKELESIGDVRIIEYKGEEVGWLSQRIQDKDELYISNFYIRSDFQGKGLGSKILNFYPKIQKNLGVANILVDANLQMPNVMDFYKKNSFETKIEDKNEKSDIILNKYFTKLVRSTSNK